jgi:hypothetical protein
VTGFVKIKVAALTNVGLPDLKRQTFWAIQAKEN